MSARCCDFHSNLTVKMSGRSKVWSRNSKAIRRWRCTGRVLYIHPFAVEPTRCCHCCDWRCRLPRFTRSLGCDLHVCVFVDFGNTWRKHGRAVARFSEGIQHQVLVIYQGKHARQSITKDNITLLPPLPIFKLVLQRNGGWPLYVEKDV